MPRRPRLQAFLDELKSATVDGPFRAFRHPDFARFATGQTISLVGTWMQMIAQGWLVLELTGSAFDVGMVTTLGTLPILLFTLYGGVVADRVDKRRFIMILQGIMMVEAAALAGLTLSGVVTVHWVWALALIHGTAVAFEVPARQSYLVELVPREDLVSAAALNSTIYNLARVIGPGVAGVVLAVSYVAVLVGLVKIRHREELLRSAERPSVFTGVHFIAAEPTLKALTSQMILMTIFGVSFIPILPVFARDVLGTEASGYGALTSAIGIGAAMGAIIVGGIGRRIPRARLASGGAIALGVSVISFSLMRSLTPGLICMAVTGAAMATTGISTATSLQLAASSDLRGRVMAVYSFVVLGLAPVGAFQAGWVGEHWGTPIAIGASGVIALLGAFILRSRLWPAVEG
jgi:MFS family permease